eukprot:15366023-Ditylum_brightwellii.AAC.2
MLIMSKLYNLNTRSIDLALAYPQAEVKSTIYLFPSLGIIISGNGNDYVLQLKKNLYGLKDTGRTWWEHLSSGLERMGFKQCNAKMCVFKKDGVIIIVYVNDCLIFANSKEESDEVVRELKRNVDIIYERETIEQYVGVKIDHNLDGTFRMY